MRYAIIEKATRKVVNVVEWDGQLGWGPPAGHDVRRSDTADPGDAWNGAEFTRPAPPPPPPDEKALFAAASPAEKLLMLARRAGLA